MLSSLFVAATLAFTGADADFAYACASNLVSACTPRDAGTAGAHKAADWIFDTVRSTGADIRQDRFSAPVRLASGEVAMRRFINLYASFVRDAKAPWTVYVSHYDTKPESGCPGANDGASTTGLLIALAAAFTERGQAGRGNVMLVWLDGEECLKAYGDNDGFWGSRRAAGELRRKGLDVRAVVCFDMLGDRDLHVTMPQNGSPTLMKAVKAAARAAGIDVVCIDKTVRDDHVAFLEAGYTAVDLIDFQYGSAPGRNDWWHTPQDTMDKVSRDSLAKTGRLAVELLDVLGK